MSNDILFDMRGPALVITFNRPTAGNAFTPDMATLLFNRLKLVTTDRNVRAVVLRGAGGCFMNGLEMALYIGSIDTALSKANQMIQPYHGAIRELQVMEKPVLAIVEGRVSGPGLSLMLASDCVIAGRGAIFNGGFTANALTPDGGASHFLTRRVGALRATEILMLSEDFTAADAERWNLINAVVDDEKLQEVADAWIDKIALGPTRSFGSVKKLIQKAFEQDLNAQLGAEHTHWGAASRSFDFRENLKAKAEKRPPKYIGV